MDQVSEIFTITDGLTAAFGKAMIKLKDVTFRMSHMDLLYTALDQVVSGKLSHFLLSHDD